MNAYEKARERFEKINRDLPSIVRTAQRTIADAYDEYDAAWANLCQYEKSAGVPKDEYNPYGQA